MPTPSSPAYLPTDAAERAQFPMFDGLLGYFPAALAWVSRCSKVGNDQHQPGEPMHWAMDKSTDHKNKIVKHLLDSGTDDTDGVPHSVKVAWRALALAQEDLMARKGAPKPHNATGAAPPITFPEGYVDTKAHGYGSAVLKAVADDDAAAFEAAMTECLQEDGVRVDKLFKTPAEPARIATAAEIEAYDQWQAKDARGVVLLIGDTVRIVDPSHDDVLHGFGKGSFGKIAGRSADTKRVLVQELWKANTRWLNSKQLEWVRP